MVKVLLLLIASMSLANATDIVTDSTITEFLTDKYSKIESYYTEFDGGQYKGKVYFQSPNNYYIDDYTFVTIINGETTYKSSELLMQTMISKTDEAFNLYSPLGLAQILQSKFEFSSFDSTKNIYIFKAKDKYDAINSIHITFTKQFLPDYLIVYTNDDNTSTYTFKNQKVDLKINKDKFVYKKLKDYEELDLRK